MSFYYIKFLSACKCKDNRGSGPVLNSKKDCRTNRYSSLPCHLTILLILQAILLIECLDSTTGSRCFLLAGVERMTLGADLNVNLLLR